MTSPIRASGWRWSRASTERPRPRALLIAGGLLLAGFALVAVLPVIPAVQDLDERVSRSALDLALAHPAVRVPAEALSTLGRDIPAIAIMAAAVIALRLRGRRTAAAWLAASALVGYLGHLTLKALIDRPRPEWPDALATAATAAMPSGHAASGIDAWAVLGLILLVGASGWRRVPGVALIAIGLAMGPSRLLVGVHWPTDIVAGWLYGAGIACLAGAVALRLAASRRARSASPARGPRPPAR